MGKILSSIIVVELFIVVGLGFSFLMVTWWTNQQTDFREEFERDDSIVILNGTIQEIQYDLEDALYLTINNKAYNIYNILKGTKSFESETIPKKLADIYYSTKVGYTILIFKTGTTIINNITLIQMTNSKYRDVGEGRSGCFKILFTLSGMGEVVLLAAILILGIYGISQIPNYQKRYEQYREKAKKQLKGKKQLQERNKQLTKQLKEAELHLLKYTKGNDIFLGAYITKEARYCHECGSKVKGTHCSYCGAEVRT